MKGVNYYNIDFCLNGELSLFIFELKFADKMDPFVITASALVEWPSAKIETRF